MVHNKPHTKETKNKISLKNKGKRFSPKTEFKKGIKPKNWIGFKKGRTPWNIGLKGISSGMPKGSKFSKEHKKKLSLKKIGTKQSKKTIEKRKQTYKKIGLNQKEKNGMFGKKPWNYIDGRGFKYCDDWYMIRKLILERDNHMCQICKKKNIRLDIHHKIPFRESFDNSLNNLIALCRKCHVTEEIKYWRKKK